jgi:uncharacterized low-complexity protein
MSKLNSLTPIAALLAVSVATQAPVYAAESSTPATTSTKTKEGKCGAGKCGASMKTTTKPAPTPSQVMAGAASNKALAAKPASKPMPEGKCGEGKCGAKH